MTNELFTIGYSTHTTDSFLDLLRKFEISAIADVRSTPYSQFKPEFNKELLKDFLSKHKIAYVFLGDYCGARVDDPVYFAKGKVDYNLVAESQKFKEGLERIKKGMEKYRLALMCAEKDPITCHRTILICRNLHSAEIKIKHILSNGDFETHDDSEQRLMTLYNLNQPDLLRSDQQRLDEAYARQGMKISFENIETQRENLG